VRGEQLLLHLSMLNSLLNILYLRKKRLRTTRQILNVVQRVAIVELDPLKYRTGSRTSLRNHACVFETTFIEVRSPSGHQAT
jgi:hypothetical protein